MFKRTTVTLAFVEPQKFFNNPSPKYFLQTEVKEPCQPVWKNKKDILFSFGTEVKPTI